MARKNRPIVEEDPPEGAPAWMLTFCDCMTLLLTFFVLLLSFSSFDEASLKRFSGAFESMSNPSVLDNDRTIDDTLVEKDAVVDRTREGSEMPVSDIVDATINPKVEKHIADTDVYRGYKTLSLRSRGLFVGKGSRLSGNGKRVLGKIAEFMHMRLPAKVIVREVGPNLLPDERERALKLGLERSQTVVEFLTQSGVDQAGLPVSVFSVAGRSLSRAPYRPYRKILQIVLLAKDLTK